MHNFKLPMNPEPNNNEATVRLWTFQQAAVVPALKGPEAYRAPWTETPANWRIAYEWMAKQLAEATKSAANDAPIWCWHSCNGQLNAAPTVGTAAFLLSEYQLGQGMVALELAVPAEFVLLSSYNAWNSFLDFVIVNQRLPKNQRRAQKMFAEPMFKHDTDDIQAVIPFIESAWVQGVTELAVEGRDWDSPLLPGR
jgi:hypothetical protein